MANSLFKAIELQHLPISQTNHTSMALLIA